MRARGWTNVKGFLGRWRRDRRGMAATEFALVTPLLLTLYFGGYEASGAASAYQKLSDATVELANVTAQYTTMGTTDVSNVMSASAQIMYPLSISNLTITLSEITTNAASAATVTWSKTYSGSTGAVSNGLAAGSTVTLPGNLSSPSTSYVFVQTAYTWTPPIQIPLFNNVSMSSQIYMLPRASASIPYTGS